MGKAFKNFWSLNTDEALVTGILRDVTPKNIEVFIPLNAQMKDIDLVLMNAKDKKFRTIQVKGSKAYEPIKSQINKWGRGSGSWIVLDSQPLFNSITDYFCFLIYTLQENLDGGKAQIDFHTITISKTDLIKKLKRYKKIAKTGWYRFHFYFNSDTGEIFDWRDAKKKDHLESYTEYLDEKGFKKLNKDLV